VGILATAVTVVIVVVVVIGGPGPLGAPEIRPQRPTGEPGRTGPYGTTVPASVQTWFDPADVVRIPTDRWNGLDGGDRGPVPGRPVDCIPGGGGDVSPCKASPPPPSDFTSKMRH